uniref:Putative LOC100201741 [Hydra vulgaris] n=1 Tax=Lepeophtheirus salmonis TaxID=72036 RepID=A0A0K2U600_LEPSM
MPPRKKKQKVVNPNAQPGIARSHLEQNFTVMPDSLKDLKNGHVLYFFTSCGRIRAETERHLCSHFSLLDEEDYSIAAVDSTLKSLVKKTLDKFKRLSNPKEFATFAKICDESFKLLPGVEERKQNYSDNNSQDSEPDSESLSPMIEYNEDEINPTPLNEETPVTASTRSSTNKLTPREQKLKKRLDFAIRSKVASVTQHRMQMAQLRTKLKVPKRVVNQTIMRKQNTIDLKDRKIKELKAKLRGNALFQELAQARVELLQLKRTHSQLIRSRKSKKKTTVSATQHQNVGRKLKNQSGGEGEVEVRDGKCKVT